MDTIWKCLIHDNVAEIYCKTCGSYICSECLTDHGMDGHKPNYIHIQKYAQSVSLPMLDHLLKDVSGKDSDIIMEATEFVAGLGSIVPVLKETINNYAESINYLKKLLVQLESNVAPVKTLPFVELMTKGMTSDKMRLETALKDKDVKTIVSLAKKIEAESQLASSDSEKNLIKEAKAGIAGLNDIKAYKSLIKTLELLAFKCQHYRLNTFISGWKCDRKYFTSKMTLSEDGLTYGNSASNGYPAIIGDTPLESGIMAYKVTVSSLCCSGKEGFGFIELEKYKKKFASDSTTPAVYDDLMGLTHNSNVKNMRIVKGSQLTNGNTYTVKADMSELKLTIKGTNCHLEADLKPGVAYVPVFSSGCRNNKFVIKPLEGTDDE